MRTRLHWRWRQSGLMAVLLLLLPGAQAYVSYVNPGGRPQRWALTSPSQFVHPNVVNRNTRAVRYFLAADAYSEANKTAELNAARNCFDQWQLVPGTVLRFEEGGVLSGALDVNTADNTNLVYWTKTSTLVNGGFDNISGTTGVTFSDYFVDGTMAEGDIVLNGVQYQWFTDFNDSVNQAQFVESVLLHEIGHLIGLAHSPAGAATMFPRGSGGVSIQCGLSADDLAGLYAVYPDSSVTPTLGQIYGSVTLGGAPVLGAIVSADNAAGNLIASTVTRTNGGYEMPAMPPGNYQVRVSPVDPASMSFPLFRGADVAYTFAGSEANFLPTQNTPVTVKAGGATKLDFALVAGTPAFRINRIAPATTNPSTVVVVNYPSKAPYGATEVTVGVYTTGAVSSDAILQITGDGLSPGQTNVRLDVFPGVNPPLNLVSIPVQIAANATPGMRTLILQDAGATAYANGFLEIPTTFPDYNYDGLDDRFQHQYFARWTASDAAPGADPDGDGFDNTTEYIAGSNPVDPTSVLKVESVRLDATGATVTWPSAAGRRYQVLSRPRLDSIRSWQPVGSPITATGSTTQFLDASITADLQFYRIQALP